MNFKSPDENLFENLQTITMSSSTTSKVVKVSDQIELHLTLTKPAGNVDTNAPTLFFLHFWGGSSNTFLSVTNILKPFFPTVALSFRGWGASSGPDEAASYTITDFSTDVETVIQTLGLKSAVLVGHSMGGKVAVAVAGRHVLPAGVLNGLALLAPAPPGPLSLPNPSMREQQIHAFDNTENSEVVIRTVLTAPENPALTDELVKSTAEDMVRGNKWAKAAWPTYGMAEDIRELFSRVDIPVLVVAGGSDIIEPAERMRTEIQEKINSRPNGKASLVIIEGSGHLLPVEKPNEVAQSIKEFVESL